MELIVLGASGGYPAAREPCSGYLLCTQESRLWFETGGGTLTEALEWGPLSSLDGIWISHVHPDHCSDLLVAYQRLAFGPEHLEHPIPLHAPAEVLTRMDDFLGPDNPLGRVFDPVALHPEMRLELGSDITLHAIQTAHSVETYGFRAASRAQTVGFSADCGPGEELLRIADGVDLFVCEAGLTSEADRAFHVSPEIAGETAKRADAAAFLLTHIPPSVDRDDARRRAEIGFGRPPIVASRGLVVQVGGGEAPAAS